MQSAPERSGSNLDPSCTHLPLCPWSCGRYHLIANIRVGVALNQKGQFDRARVRMLMAFT